MELTNALGKPCNINACPCTTQGFTTLKLRHITKVVVLLFGDPIHVRFSWGLLPYGTPRPRSILLNVGLNIHCCCNDHEATVIEFYGARLIRIGTIEPEIAFVVAIEFHSKILLKHLAYAKLASFLFTEKEFQDLAKQTEGKRLRKNLWDSEESERLLFCSISPLQKWVLFFNLRRKLQSLRLG